MFPSSRPEQLKAIACETARMGYPGSSMSRAKTQIVKGGTKAILEKYFLDVFPLNELWNNPNIVVDRFDEWHENRVDEMARALAGQVCGVNVAKSVSAKFLNTFLHQLVKYENARPILPKLHLPLDSKVFKKLRAMKSPALAPVKKQLGTSPYQLPYSEHVRIQEALLGVVDELNGQPTREFKVAHRIELNWLWL